jgi:hypothetical protein
VILESVRILPLVEGKGLLRRPLPATRGGHILIQARGLPPSIGWNRGMMQQFSTGSAMKMPFARLNALSTGCALVVLCGLRCIPSRVSAAPDSGEAVYKEFCASCHDHPGPRIPPRTALQKLSVTRILHTLDFGVMMRVAYPMQRPQREAVARFLGRAGEDAGPGAAAFCASREISWAHNATGDAAGSWTGWSSSDANMRFQSAEHSGLNEDKVRKLKLKWAYGFAGDIAAFAAPTVRNGTLFVGSAGGDECEDRLLVLDLSGRWAGAGGNLDRAKWRRVFHFVWGFDRVVLFAGCVYGEIVVEAARGYA